MPASICFFSDRKERGSVNFFLLVLCAVKYNYVVHIVHVFFLGIQVLPAVSFGSANATAELPGKGYIVHVVHVYNSTCVCTVTAVYQDPTQHLTNVTSQYFPFLDR